MSNTTLRRLLACLSDGELHSGKALGETLGVSRAAVWKHIQQAQLLGLPISAQKGLGYHLPMALQLLDADDIRQHLLPAARSALASIDVLFSVDSTNNYALERLRAGADQPFAVLAEMQTAGRGRRGRTWHSPFACHIYLTLGWRCRQGLSALEGLSLVAGLQLLESLQATGFPELQLKWPNDLLWRQRKLAGVLIDVQGDPAGDCQVALGIGLNVHSLATDTGLVPIDQPWTSLQQVAETLSCPLPSRNALVAELLNRLLPAIHHMEQEGFAPYRAAWQSHDYCFGQRLRVQAGNSAWEGVGAGVNGQGAYLLDTAQGQQAVSGGEISLRPQVAVA